MADKEKHKIACSIMTPEKPVYEGEIAMIVAPGVEGEIGIMALHAPMVVLLKIGGIRIRESSDPNADEKLLAIGGGFLEVSEDKVTVLTATAEFAEFIDVERAEKARRKAEEELIKARLEKTVEFSLIQADLERALNRLSISGRNK